MPRLHTLTLALSLGLISTGAIAAEPVLRMSGEAAIGAKAEAAPQWRLAAASTGDTALAFRDLPITRIAELQKRNQRPGNIATQIGIARDIGETVQGKLAPLKWQAVEGGAVARIVVSSPDALALRVGLSIDALPAGAELRFAGSLAPQSILFVGGADAKGQQVEGAYWTPMTDGDAQTIEVFVPAGVATDAVKLSVTQASHILTNSIERFSLAKAIGDSGACNVNAVCRVAALGQNYTNSKNAVARMVYQSGASSYTCTGTLLNDTVAATQIPYFYTADHCISTQAEATTLNTFWGFEAATCAGTTAAANTQLTGGAQYLYSDAQTDASLLRLNGTPPAGAFFNGWNATALANNSQVLAIHHPSGDLKKSSLGVKMAQDTVNHEVAWTEGTTEGGSSGSGLFTASANGYELRGGLYGGSASCANTGNTGNTQNRDWYSRLDVIFPQIQQYLAPSNNPPAGPTRDYTGAWYVPSESGWGLTAFQYNNASNTLFVMFFIYDGAGNAKWYELDGGWSASDVRSGAVLQSNGPAWSTTFNPASRTFSNAGTATLTFTSATTATLQFTVNGVTRSAALQKL